MKLKDNLLPKAFLSLAALMATTDGSAQAQENNFVSRNAERSHVEKSMHNPKISDKVVPHFFGYPDSFQSQLRGDYAKNLKSGRVIYEKILFNKVPINENWINRSDSKLRLKRDWSDVGYSSDVEKSWIEYVNRIALKYPEEIISNPEKLSEAAYLDAKPYLDIDHNWRAYPQHLVKFIEAGLDAQQVGNIKSFLHRYDSVSAPLEMSQVVNLVINDVTPEDLKKENADVSLAISRKNENKFYELFESYCKEKDLVFKLDQLKNYVKNNFGVTETPPAIQGKKYLPQELSYSRLDGQAVFETVKNLIELDRLKALPESPEKQELISEFLRKTAVFAIGNDNHEKVFEAGSGLRNLAQASSEKNINLLVYEINASKPNSPQRQIPDFLRKLTFIDDIKVGKVNSLTMAGHGDPVSITLVRDFSGHNGLFKNEGSYSVEDIDIFAEIGSMIDSENGVINLQSCETAGVIYLGMLDAPPDNIAEIIAVASGIPVNAPSTPIPNGGHFVVKNGDGGHSAIASHGLCSYLICPDVGQNVNSNLKPRQPIRNVMRRLFAR